MALKIIFFVLCIQFLTTVVTSNLCPESVSKQPQQIHLSLGYSHSEIYVTWITFDPNVATMVKYGTDGQLTKIEHGYVTKFVDGEKPYPKTATVRYVHRVALKNLKPKTTYSYKCGSNKEGWSEQFSFTTMQDDTNWSPRMLVLGDYGLVDGNYSFSGLLTEAKNKTVDLFFHNGDFAYDFDANNGTRGDEFMRFIEPIASQIVYQTSPGNHEKRYNFSHYYERFTMRDMTNTGAGDWANTTNFYAFYLGPALIVSIQTDAPWVREYGNELITQKNWLRAVLSEANQPENRQKHPWVIVFGHRPLYNTCCRNWPSIDVNCTKEAEWLREQYEDILYDYGVDLAIWAHEHNYERMWPVYKEKIFVDNIEEPYRNPKVPIHLVVGNAGAHESPDFFTFPRKPYSAFGYTEYGYGILEIINSTHLTFTAKVTSGPHVTPNNPIEIDSITIIQEHHGPRY